MMQILQKDRGHTFLVIQLGDNDRQANIQTPYSYIKKKTREIIKKMKITGNYYTVFL